MPYTPFMRVSTGNGRYARARAGFSLVELSIVVAILSFVSVLGLEAAAGFLSHSAYTDTETQIQTLDQALDAYYQAYGYLPCPAAANLAPTDNRYGVPQDCTKIAPIGSSDVMAGMVPFRALNLPAEMAIDGFGSRIYYFVTNEFTVSSASLANNPAQIEIRSGVQAQPCSGDCSILALPDASLAVSTGAAYAVLSVGADQRGGISAQGATINACAKTLDTRIDARNCIGVAPSGSLAVAVPDQVLYDSRYNDGVNDANYFDDIIVWRPKDKL